MTIDLSNTFWAGAPWFGVYSAPFLWLSSCHTKSSCRYGDKTVPKLQISFLCSLRGSEYWPDAVRFSWPCFVYVASGLLWNFLVKSSFDLWIFSLNSWTPHLGKVCVLKFQALVDFLPFVWFAVWSTLWFPWPIFLIHKLRRLEFRIQLRELFLASNFNTMYSNSFGVHKKRRVLC